MTTDAVNALGHEGPFARCVSGFAPRAAQQAMAQAVAETLDAGARLIIEAGTGTGKTYAYLVPSLLSGRRVIISTGTRTLQDQLFHRDLPVVAETLGVSVRAALLKGRANYLCRYRLDSTCQSGRLRSRELVDQLQKVKAWSGRTRSGDIAEVGDVPEDSSLWPLVTSTVDNCLGQECPAFSDCFVAKARREAQEADLVVINHHLLFADMALKEEGFGDLLPGAHAFVLDEAHQLPDVASSFFGISLSGRQLLELARDTMAEHLRDARDAAELGDGARELERAVKDFRLALGNPERRVAWSAVAAEPAIQRALETLRGGVDRLAVMLEPQAQRGKGLEQCWRRARQFVERLQGLLEPTQDQYIQWLDVHRRSFTLHLTPLDVADTFQAHMQAQNAAWVFTSATLAVGDSFDHFAHRLGIGEAAAECLESPFDYPRNALLYIPKALPDPADSGYTAAVVEAALPVLEASGGRAFMLFTSHRALRAAEQALRARIRYPLLVQGEAPRAELLERFRALGDAVLLGTNSFWEGVDVRGSALSCVIIDRLPFASPGDPVLKARIEGMRREGGNPFMEYQLPNAVIALKQGVGRLIRDVNDRGVMMLCDPRLVSRPYGRMFLHSLPPMARTRELGDVEQFFAAESPQQTETGDARRVSP